MGLISVHRQAGRRAGERGVPLSMCVPFWDVSNLHPVTAPSHVAGSLSHRKAMDGGDCDQTTWWKGVFAGKANNHLSSAWSALASKTRRFSFSGYHCFGKSIFQRWLRWSCTMNISYTFITAFSGLSCNVKQVRKLRNNTELIHSWNKYLNFVYVFFLLLFQIAALRCSWLLIHRSWATHLTRSSTGR